MQAASASCIAIAGDGRPLLSGRSLHLASSRVVLDARIFPNHFELVPVQAEEFFTQIAFGHVVDPLRARAAQAFDAFFFGRARDVYPQYDFKRMNEVEFGATLELG